VRKEVTVDASLAAKWAMPEVYTQQALALVSQWAREETWVIAPCLLLTEVTNAFYKRVLRGEMAVKAAVEALHVVMGFGIEIWEETGLHSRALELSHQLKRPSTYDCHYLALAESHDCPLWTGDERFYNAVKKEFPLVRWIGSVPAT
jgi:predicted nucleic acid-binding protein